MTKFTLAALAACIALTPVAAMAQMKPMELRAVRITSPEPAKLADWYNTTFGFKKLEAPGAGGAVELPGGLRLTIAAKQPTAAQDDVAHVLINVAQLDPLLNKAKANGATVVRGPTKSALDNMVVFIRDPGGNVVELIGPVPGATKIN